MARGRRPSAARRAGRTPGLRVLGPADIPVITDVEAARADPGLAVLSVAAHAHEPGAEHIALTALAAAETLDGDRAIVYPDRVTALLGAAARTALEQLMHNFQEYQGSFARFVTGTIEARGEARGQADTLLKLLQRRGHTLPEERRKQILACRDPEQLDRWIDGVFDGRDLDDIFA